MNFENFINHINTDENYRKIVKDILTNDSCALHNAPEYLKTDKDLVLFACKYDRLIGEHIGDELKKDKEFLVKFAKYNHTVPCFMDESLRKDKVFLANLVRSNYKTMLLLNIDEIV